MRQRAALVFGVLAIIAGITIGGLKIARADAGGTCIYSPGSNPVKGYPTFPACTNTRALKSTITDPGSNTSAQVVNVGDTLGNGTGLITLDYLLGYNGSSWDRLHAANGELETIDGGNIRMKVSETTCTLKKFASNLVRIWSAGTETATLSIYDEGSSPTCAAADLVWSGVPSSTPIVLEVLMNYGIAIKFSAAPAVPDYVTTN